MRIVLAQLNPTVGDLAGNSSKIVDALAGARSLGAELVLFPELALCGYPPEDLLLLDGFVSEIEARLQDVIDASGGLAVVVGMARREGEALYNSAAVIEDGKLLGYQDKTLLPTYDVFDEQRYFRSAGQRRLWELAGKRVAVTVCEDIWQQAGKVPGGRYLMDPIEDYAALKPELLLNLSASPYSVGQLRVREEICRHTARALGCPVVLCNQVGANDSLIFDGSSLYVDASGELDVRGPSFEEKLIYVDTDTEQNPQYPSVDGNREIYDALVLGVRDYFRKQGFEKACLGLSGGIDSAVVACIATEALGADNVVAVAMPSRYSSPESLEDAEQLAQALGIELREIPIEGPFQSYLDLLEPQWVGRDADLTEENLQSRVRGMILMALSNKFGWLVLTTGNKSELAMGYATLYGDMCGALGVLADVAKYNVYGLARIANTHKKCVPERIFDKPPSAELRFDQRDTDSLPDYEILDTVVEQYLEEGQTPEAIANTYGFDLMLVRDLVRRLHRSEYKRQQYPAGLRVTSKAFTKGWRFPIVQSWSEGSS